MSTENLSSYYVYEGQPPHRPIIVIIKVDILTRHYSVILLHDKTDGSTVRYFAKHSDTIDSLKLGELWKPVKDINQYFEYFL